MTYPGFSILDGLSKIYYFIDFGHSSRIETVEDRDVTLSQIQGSTVKCSLPIKLPFIFPIFISKTLMLLALWRFEAKHPVVLSIALRVSLRKCSSKTFTENWVSKQLFFLILTTA
jgi:hypothetical protein